MVIKLNRFKNDVFFTFVLTFSFHQYLDADEKLSLNKLNNKISLYELPESKFDNLDPLNGLTLNLNKKVNSHNKNISNIKISDELILNSGEFIQIRGVDNKLLLFNGKLLIKFKDFPNLEDFAYENELSYISNLSDINIGVFKVNNLLELESKINQIKSNQNIISIELDTKDPAIRPN